MAIAFGKLVRGIDLQDLGLVSLGGMLGGLLQPVVATMNPDLAARSSSFSFFDSALLGIAAAGISVFVLANSKMDDKLRVLFFSILCGLAFPAILSGAVDSVSVQTKQAQVSTDLINSTGSTNGKAAIPNAAVVVEKGLMENPASSLEPVAAGQLQAAANNVVDRIKADAARDPSAVRVEELQQIGVAARDSGHDGTVVRVTQALKELETVEGLGDQASKAGSVVLGAEPMPAEGTGAK